MSDPIQTITMPKWGLAMDEGMVVDWLVEEGAEVAAGAEVLEIETTKITNVFESPVSGTLRRRLVAEGEVAPVGALLAVVADTSVADAEIDAFIERFQAEFAVAAEAAAESASAEPETVAVGEHQINYLKTGEGPPLLLIHGFGGDLNNWLFNQPALSESHSVYALDLPGHGRSGKALGEAGMAMLAGVLGGFMDALEIDAAHLVGHSMGGALGLVFALERPERVRTLTMIAPGGLGAEINMDFINGFIEAGKRKEMKAVLELLVADPSLISPATWSTTCSSTSASTAWSRPCAASRRRSSPAAARETGPEGQLAQLSVPAQAIWGRQDKVLPAKHAEALPQNVAVHLLDDIGHMPHMEAAAEVNRLIAALAD